ncbi:MAG: TIR domain-containing protein [Verrucomicrobia bacterium]|nr:TIR domain-containing protein [Verrucomicrobiota bacterium]
MHRDRDLQLRILRSVRGDEKGESFKDLPEDFVAYNAALLIDEGLVEGQAIKGSSGQYVAAALISLTSAGHDYLDSIEATSTSASLPACTHTTMTVFISHSSADSRLAASLVSLLRLAFSLSANEIRCTSVEGYRLSVGADTDEQLRREVRESQVFLAVMTPASARSSYVLFELGARWGAKLPLYPVLGRGAGRELLAGPLSGINALDIRRREQVYQLVEDVGRVLDCSPTSPSALEESVQSVINAAFEEDQGVGTDASSLTQVGLAPTAVGILRCLFDEDRRMAADEVAEVFSLPSSEAKHYLDQLLSTNYVDYRPGVVMPRQLLRGAQTMPGSRQATYGITSGGRAYIMKQKS